jgi:AcrR family transcriptional regulator
VVTRISQLRPRRQARGEQRIEQILDAATRVLSKVGYNRATTNAIAAEAGISPGSLYQFFANKEQIADALERRYAERIAASSRPALDSVAPLADRVDALVDEIVAFSCDMPGFQALFSERPYSAGAAQAAHAHHEAFIGQLDAIVADAAPQMSTPDRARITQVGTQICRAVIPVIVAAKSSERQRLTAELKAALTGYLESRAAGRTSRSP